MIDCNDAIIRDLGSSDKVVSEVLLRLFKLVFGSVALFVENEPVLQPHLAIIITSSIKFAGEVKVCDLRDSMPNEFFSNVHITQLHPNRTPTTTFS